MPGANRLSYWDYDKETGKVSIPTAPITDINYAALTAGMAAFSVAVNAVTLGVLYKDVKVASEEDISGVPPNDDAAQREKKWLVRMHDAVTFKKHTMELPTADTSKLDEDSRGQMDKSGAEYIALKAAIEAIYETEVGNAVVVDEAIFVGRNL